VNRRGFLQGLFAAATAPLVPDVLRPTLLDMAKTATATVVKRGVSVAVLNECMREIAPLMYAALERNVPIFDQFHTLNGQTYRRER
jgi:hypothetical protein